MTTVWDEKIEEFITVPRQIYDASEYLESDRIRGKFKLRDHSRLRFLLVSYDLFARHVKHFLKTPWDMVIADESQKIKSRTAKRSRAMHRVGDRVTYKLLLTGTPLGNKGEIDIWSQYRFLSSAVFGKNFTPFKKRYFRKSGYMGKELKFKKATRTRYEKKLHSVAFRITKKEALSLPPVVHQRLYFDLDGPAKKAYTEIERDMVTYFERENILTTTPLAITQMLRLQQITGGYLVSDDGDIVKVGNQKVKVLKDFLEDWQDKFVVFCRFRDEIEDISRLCDKLGFSHVTYHGGTKDRTVWQRFQRRDSLQGFIGQIQTGGVGIELFAAHTAVMYSTGHSWIDYDQAISRLDRNGQRGNKTSIVHLLARNTIDIRIAEALKSTGNVVQRILDSYRR